jgi:4-amino-4-deoxy-L-arabinose transferase-like glycosyltransferase
MSYKKPGLYENFKVKEKQFLFFIILVNLIIKTLPAIVIELGNDEVYYWTYALFPDWSHFDHPPMVGLTIQLFTLNLALQSEFFIRLGPLVLSSVNIILLFQLVKRIYSIEAAYISSFLFTASVYFNIICGLFILPDTPQIFFVILALYYGLPAITAANPAKGDSLKIILFGLFTGLAFLSKYHSLFLWFGFGLYILFHDRRWLKKPYLYISIFVTLLLMTPVIYWNINNNFISFTFHESRIGLFNSPIRPESFLPFILGQCFYQNPLLSIIYILTLFSLFRKGRHRLLTVTDKLLLYLSVPLILVFSLSSLFNDTLPHWTGPAFIGLIILSSGWLNEKLATNRKKVITTLVGANALVILAIMFGIAQINYGLFFSPEKWQDTKELGTNDVTLDMYGWHQAGVKFEQFLKKETIEQKDFDKVKIITNNWFPASHIDFYMAHPLNIDLFVAGTLGESHKYFWINKARSINKNDRIFYITSSQFFKEPGILTGKYDRIVPKDTIQIKRNGETVKNFFVYEVIDSKVIISHF